MPAGRPLAFKSVEELEAKIQEYFDNEDLPTMSGLGVHLGVDRKTIVNYSRKEEYFHTIKKARAVVESFLEKQLYGNQVTGVIFNLKNNFGWNDKQQQEITGVNGGAIQTQHTVTFVKPE